MDRMIEKKIWTTKRITFISIGTVVLFLLIYNILFGDRNTKLNIDSERLTISTVNKGLFQEYIPVPGTVIPITTIYLDAVEGGRVEKVFLKAGSMVEKNDGIVQLENTNLLLDIMYREAELFNQINNLRSTRLAMEQSRLNLRREIMEVTYQIQKLNHVYERNKALMEKNLITRQDYEQSKEEYEYQLNRKELVLQTQKQDSLFRQAQIAQLESSLKRMQANLNLSKQKLENLVVKAPIAGQLTSLNAEIGESKRPGERLGQIDVLNDFKVRAGIDEHYIARITTGLQGEFDFAETTYKLTITKVYPEVRDGKFEVDLEFESESPKGIRRGQTVHIRLALGDLSESLLLARGGFYQKTGGNWVFVLNSSGTVALKRTIKLGRQNPLNFEVIEGLESGEKVVTSSYDDFGDVDELVLKK